jgi:hypothetical protein
VTRESRLLLAAVLFVAGFAVAACGDRERSADLLKRSLQDPAASEELHQRHRLLTMVVRRDFVGAEIALESAFEAYRVGEMGSNRLRRRVEAIELANGVDLAPQLDEWVERRPDSWQAALARGLYRLRQAWDARGGDVAAATPGIRFENARDLAAAAEKDLRRAASVELARAFAHTGLISSSLLTGQGLEERRRLFDTAWASDRNFNSLARAFHETLLPEWGGSEELMLGFRNELARQGATSMQLSELDAAFYVRRARHLFHEGDLRGARSALRAAEGKLATPDVLKGVAELAMRDGDLKEVARAMERNVRENDPWDLYSLELLLQATRALGRQQESEVVLRQLHELHQRYRNGE